MIWLLLYYIYHFLNLNYFKSNSVKSPIDKGKAHKLLIYFFFCLSAVLKLVTKCKIKCYCSYYNLWLAFLFIHRFSSFGVILCFRVFFLGDQLLKIQHLLPEITQSCLDVSFIDFLKFFSFSI